MGISPILNLIRGGSAAKRLLFASSSSSSLAAAAYVNVGIVLGSRSLSSSSLVGHTTTTDNNQNQNQNHHNHNQNSRNGRWYHSAGAGLPSYMRAAVFREPNKPLALEEFHIPRPKSGELLIKTKGVYTCLSIYLTH